MRKIFCLLFIFVIIIYFYFLSYSKKYITPAEAINYIGQEKTVCGVVASTKYAFFTKGRQPFLILINLIQITFLLLLSGVKIE